MQVKCQLVPRDLKIISWTENCLNLRWWFPKENTSLVLAAYLQQKFSAIKEDKIQDLKENSKDKPMQRNGKNRKSHLRKHLGG